jgi:hypothetical protein
MSEPDVDYEGLDRLLGALAEGVASRVHVDETALSGSSEIPETLPAAWRQTATSVQADTLPRGVPIRTVVRGVVGHFLPAQSVVAVPLLIFVFIVNSFDYALFLTPLLVWFLITLGFGLGLGALSPLLYPHSNPDGRRSEVAGFISLFACFPIGWGLAWLIHLLGSIPGFGWLLPLVTSGRLGESVVLVLSGMALAVLTYAPWLRRTSRIAPVSPPGRWRKPRAIMVTGGVGAALFGAFHVVWFLPPGLAAGRIDGVGLYYILAIASSFGFLAGVAFAIALAVVYRRYAVEELRAWRAGLWGALAAAIPPLVIHLSRPTGHPNVPPPLAEFLTALIIWNLPGFLMGYAAVKLAQRSGPTE